MLFLDETSDFRVDAGSSYLWGLRDGIFCLWERHEFGGGGACGSVVDWIFVSHPPEFIWWNSIPQFDGLRWWSLWEVIRIWYKHKVGSLMTESVPLWRSDEGFLPLSPLCHVRFFSMWLLLPRSSQQSAAEKRAFIRTQPCWHPDSDF